MGRPSGKCELQLSRTAIQLHNSYCATLFQTAPACFTPLSLPCLCVMFSCGSCWMLARIVHIKQSCIESCLQTSRNSRRPWSCCCWAPSRPGRARHGPAFAGSALTRGEREACKSQPHTIYCTRKTSTTVSVTSVKYATKLSRTRRHSEKWRRLGPEGDRWHGQTWP